MLRLILVPESFQDQKAEDQDGDAEVAAHQPQGHDGLPQTDEPYMLVPGAAEDLLALGKFEEKKVPESWRQCRRSARNMWIERNHVFQNIP